MAPLPVIPDVFRLALNWTSVSAGIAVNVTHWEKVTPTTPLADAADLIDQWLANDAVAMYGSVASTANGSTLVATPLDGVTASVSGVATTIAGTATGTVTQAAALIKFTTAKRGPRYRGRIFLPYLGENVQEGSVLVGNALPSVLGPAWATFATNMLADDWRLVVASYKFETAEPVTSVTSEAIAGTQKRRNDRLRNP